MDEVCKEIYTGTPVYTKIVFILMAVLVFVLSLCSHKYPQDNPIEELMEAKIKTETGVNMDLSPSSPEM